MAKSIVARRKAVPADETISPTKRLRLILEAYDGHAFAVPRNALVADKTPEEALKACRELASWLYRTAFQAGEYSHGEHHVYLTLVHALQSLEQQLEPLFDGLRALAKEARP